MEEYILEGKDISSNEQIEKHAEWVKKFLPKYSEITKRKHPWHSSERDWNRIYPCSGRCRSIQMYDRGKRSIYAFS